MSIISSLVFDEETANVVDFFNDGSGVALYKFNNNATEESGIYNGTERSVTYETGKYGNAVKFAGTSASYISGVPARASNQDEAVSFWIKFSSTSVQELWGNNGTSTSLSIFRLFYTATSWIISPKGTSSNFIPTVPSLSTGVFHHIVIMHNSTGYITIYINNTFIVTSSTAYPGIFDKLYFGRGRDNYCSAAVDQLRIFNKILNATEVSQLYTEVSS